MVVAFSTYLVTILDDQSYYATSFHALMEETISSIEANDSTFLERLRELANAQPLTYENRGNLLESVRRFRSEGEAIRANQKR